MYQITAESVFTIDKRKNFTALDKAIEKLRARYRGQLPTAQDQKYSWPINCVNTFVSLALIEREKVTLQDDHIDDITNLTLQGGVDIILRKKKRINGLREIFHYNTEPIPRLILTMGGPGGC